MSPYTVSIEKSGSHEQVKIKSRTIYLSQLLICWEILEQFSLVYVSRAREKNRDKRETQQKSGRKGREVKKK